MSASRRGRIAATIITLVVVTAGVAFAVVFVGGRTHSPADGLRAGPSDSSGTTAPPLRICPLSGLHAPTGTVPSRPALAVKIENLPAARPQTGLSWADIVYEEPVEADITRFIAVYQCNDASRIEPVRSARLTDPGILVQFGKPLFGYAGGVPEVTQKVRDAGIIDVNFNTARASKAYHRDPNRSAPHNLYTSTRELYDSVPSPGGPPQAVFTYARDLPTTARAATEVHVPFSNYSDVFWRYNAGTHKWLRWHGTVPHTLSDGTQVSARNVVVQVVQITTTDIKDVNGVSSPEVVSTGTGKAYVFRDGKVIAGTWRRPSLSAVTKYYDSQGNEIPLGPGNTWVELAPTKIHVSFS